MSIEQSSGQKHCTKQGNVSLDMCKFKTLDKDINKTKFYVRSLEQFQFRRFLLLFSSETFVFSFVT